ncbi:MAG: Ig-like domain-containing protein [Myxococcales bacterium]|jgi:hypothetical protein
MHVQHRLSLLAALVLSFSLAACGDDPTPEPPDASSPADASLDPDAGSDKDAGKDPDTDAGVDPEPDGGTTDGSIPVEDLELRSVTPAFGSSSVPVNTSVTVTFSAAVDEASVTSATFFLYRTSSGADAKVAGDFTFSSGATAVTFRPSSSLANGTGYTLVVKGGESGVAGAQGERLASDITGSFTTASSSDQTAPTVASIDPADGAEDVPLDAVITVRFSEQIDPASLSAESFELIEWWDGNPQGAPLAATWDTSANPTIVFTPAQRFDVGDEIKFTVFAGGVKDLAGNALKADYSIIFDCAWVSPENTPRVVSTTPADGSTGVPTSAAITITFNKRMRQATVTSPTNVKLYRGSDPAGAVTMTRETYNNPTFVFYPQATLQPNTQYTLRVMGGASGVKDESDNPMTGDFTARFTTGSGADTSPLEVVSVSPADGATGVAPDAAVEITFNKPVDPASVFLNYPGTTGTLRVSRYADGTFPEEGTLDLSSNPTVRFQIDPGTAYEIERTYHVKITGGAQGVRALSGATMAADFASTFTIQAPVEGTIADLRAVDGVCAIRVRGVYMTYFRGQPDSWKGFFIQDTRGGPGIYVVTGNRNPSPGPPPMWGATRYPNIDITVSRVGDFEGFKQVLAFSMTENTAAAADFIDMRRDIIEVIGDVPIGEEHESEYVQIDGTLTNYRPGGSKRNRLFDLAYGTNRRVTIKIDQDELLAPLGIPLSNSNIRVRIVAPVQQDEDGYFIKPFVYTTDEPQTAAFLDDPANWGLLPDIVRLTN